MTVQRLDKMAHAISESVSRCREKIEEASKIRLNQIIHTSAEGTPETLSWECCLPAGEGTHKRFEFLRIPIAEFYEGSRFEIGHLSISMACKIKEKHTAGHLRLTAVPVYRKQADGMKIHRIEMIAGSPALPPVVKIDGMPITDLMPEHAESLLPNHKYIAEQSSSSVKAALILTVLLMVSALVGALLFQ